MNFFAGSAANFLATALFVTFACGAVFLTAVFFLAAAFVAVFFLVIAFFFVVAIVVVPLTILWRDLAASRRATSLLQKLNQPLVENLSQFLRRAGRKLRLAHAHLKDVQLRIGNRLRKHLGV